MMQLLLIVLLIGIAHPLPALQSAGEPVQQGLSGSSVAQPPQEGVAGESLGPRLPPRPGEICILCNSAVGPDDSVYLVQGQRVPMHAGAEEREFLLHPRRYLVRLKPVGGALLGADSNQPGMANRAGNDRPGVSGVWIYSGLYILVGLIFAAACAHRALHAGYSPKLWFALGLFLNVLAYILLLILPKREVYAPAGVPSGLGKIAATHAPQRCAQCGAFNHPSASRCLHCGANLSPGVESEVNRAGLRVGS